MSDHTSPGPEGRPRLILPFLGCVYGGLNSFAETLLRVVAGVALVIHGWPKIQAPFGSAEMVAGLGFWPADLWSLLLSVTEFVGGILLIVGFLTRPAALAATAVLLVTVYAHWVVWGQGWDGAEKSVIWAAVTFFFVIRGANRHSVDAAIGKQF